MTTKSQVDLRTYQKNPRQLTKSMERELREGGLHPLLAAVNQDDSLRLDIRDRRFNIYYAGGSLLRVDGRSSPWSLRFDKKYFTGGTVRPPTGLPSRFSTEDDSKAWVQAFPDLKAGMDEWWRRHPWGEKKHCQAMASANSAGSHLPPEDYLVLDLEYQWAQRRFDLIAARRNNTQDDSVGWVEPHLVFVEVKCAYGACSGPSGLGDHARDYRDITVARNRLAVQDIKFEYQHVINQKKRLGLINQEFPFQRFTTEPPELLMILIGLDLNFPRLQKALEEVREVANDLNDSGRIILMRIDFPNYTINSNSTVTLANGS